MGSTSAMLTVDASRARPMLDNTMPSHRRILDKPVRKRRQL